MTRTFAGLADHRRNNFNLLRTICAITVIVSHAFPLATGDAQAEPFLSTGITPGMCAVIIFFAVSGFLIAGSFDRTPDLVRFATSRVRRIYPAYFASLLFSTLVLGALVTTLPIEVYYLSPVTLWHAAANAAFYTTVTDLPGVFANNPHPYTMNGSLWSLPLEVLCYFALYCAGRAGLLRGNRCALFVLLGLAASVAWRTYGLGGALPHVVPSFLTGTALYAYRERIPASGLLFAAMVITTYAARNLPFHAELVRATIAYGALSFATGATVLGRSFAQGGDYSYGLYLYGWPVTQSIINAFPGIKAFELLVLALPATAILAAASWHFVEKRALLSARVCAASAVDWASTEEPQPHEGGWVHYR